MQMEI